MSDAKKDAASPPPAPAEGGKSSKLMPMLVGLNSLLLVGVLGFMGFQMMHKPAAAPTEPAAEADAAGEEKPVEHAEKPKEEKKPEKKEGGGEEKKAEGEGHEGGAAGAHANGKGPGPMVKLADFIVHLRNPELDRYARMSFDVEVMAESDKEALNANLPRVRDAFISYLSDRTLEELRGSEGLTRTKDALQNRLREVVPEARVKGLYISDFVVQ